MSGIGIFVICILIAASGFDFHHYLWALVLLGIGWNLLFVSGNALITSNLSSDERYKHKGFMNYL